LLRGPEGAAGQEATGRTVRRHPAQTAAQGGHRRPPARPAHPPQGAGHPAPERRMRVVRPAGHGGNPPGPQAGRSHLAGQAAARLGGPDGENAAQDAYRLRTLPPGHPRREAGRGLHVNIAGEPGALKGARPVRTGGRRKRTCATGTSPAAYRCYYLAEAAGLEVWLVNARDVKHLPGRSKTDLLTELPRGLLKVSGRTGTWVATVAGHDHRRRSTAGLVPSGSAAVRLA